MTKYALLTYSTGNTGDDIQSLAAKRFLPRVDYFINRDYINDFVPDSDEDIKLIMNGWYTHHPENFPPKQKQIKPLLTSIYIDNPIKEAFSSDQMKAFFKANAPVGGRSHDTANFLDSLVGDSYFSGCMTLTLRPETSIKKRDFILAVDVPNQVYDKLVAESNLPVMRMGVDIAHQYLSPQARLKVAQYYLYLYQSARFVVTTRLHATLPCLPLGTPVLNLEEVGFEPERFDGLRDLANHMTVEEFLTGDFDINSPAENPQAYLPIKENLENICTNFTGFSNDKGFLDGQDLLDFLTDPDLVQSQVTGLWSACQHWGIRR
ncbi:polysaccharide pyruvyl transferase family protein [Streptococcus loxodontisalivarius]|uniref:Polysaccharide pyruvyl transferase domain-containing protein n=1 Tax=Streptococcus loxodontisalivarius TaxID=1349415 RepID=A0ABS2PUW9_9STRE|nr:polysaccharide pyruvyl transferase family protein [Streptococcus loxodontisalivarius]MBM7643320.1 hypothetical protein [Streptococcus loxodontisalivarius]